MKIRPKLIPPVPGWQMDLPGPNEVPNDEPSLDEYSPNHIDDVYLELPRSFMNSRGVMLWVGIFLAVFSYFCLRDFFCDECNVKIKGIGFFLALLGVWAILTLSRPDISAPRDLPLRFNRKRRKMYVYEIDAVWWNPFIRWPVRAVAYNWNDVRAEAWQQQGALNGGHVMKWGVVLSVVKPGTNEVIDRFQLRAKGDGEAAWAYICTYMQEGRGALPPAEYPSRGEDNKRAWNIAYLLAPKVKWPAAMDIESRTAPTDSACRVSTAGGA
ncbi:DUF6708 domain-containing protein [Burkholderia sp. PR2]|uniref:DUF6708 domain-containing protein n=1 Tax=Burkholderia sp. PR2 TaxID=3448078 RepID=UPI00402A9568